MHNTGVNKLAGWMMMMTRKTLRNKHTSKYTVHKHTSRKPCPPFGQKLCIAVTERGELLRGLQQAKVFNDELAKVRRYFLLGELHICLLQRRPEKVVT